MIMDTSESHLPTNTDLKKIIISKNLLTWFAGSEKSTISLCRISSFSSSDIALQTNSMTSSQENVRQNV